MVNAHFWREKTGGRIASAFQMPQARFGMSICYRVSAALAKLTHLNTKTSYQS